MAIIILYGLLLLELVFHVIPLKFTETKVLLQMRDQISRFVKLQQVFWQEMPQLPEQGPGLQQVRQSSVLPTVQILQLLI